MENRNYQVTLSVKGIAKRQRKVKTHIVKAFDAKNTNDIEGLFKTALEQFNSVYKGNFREVLTVKCSLYPFTENSGFKTIALSEGAFSKELNRQLI